MYKIYIFMQKKLIRILARVKNPSRDSDNFKIQARLNIENLLRAPCKFPVFSTLNLEIVSKYCNLHGARGLNTGISERILGAIFGIQN